jgi:hypothetical protein
MSAEPNSTMYAMLSVVGEVARVASTGDRIFQ